MHRFFSASLLTWFGVIGAIFTAISNIEKVLEQLGFVGTMLTVAVSSLNRLRDAFEQITGFQIWWGNVSFLVFILCVGSIAIGLRVTLERKLASKDYAFEEWVRAQTVATFCRRQFRGGAASSAKTTELKTYLPVSILFVITWLSGWITKPDAVQINQSLLRNMLLIFGIYVLHWTRKYIQGEPVAINTKKRQYIERKWLADLRKSDSSIHAFSQKGSSAYDEMPPAMRSYYRNEALVESLEATFARCVWVIIIAISGLCLAAYIAVYGASLDPVLAVWRKAIEVLRAIGIILYLGATLPSFVDNVLSASVGFVTGLCLRVGVLVRGRYKLAIRVGLILVWVFLSYLPVMKLLNVMPKALSSMTPVALITTWVDSVYLAFLPFILTHVTTYAVAGILVWRLWRPNVATR